MNTSFVIELAKKSQFLSTIEIDKNKYLSGGSVDERLPHLISLVLANIEWLYGVNPNDISLFDTTNYLYALCGKYALQAQYITGNSGGAIVPTPVVNTIYSPVRIQLTIPSNNALINGGTTITDGTTILNVADIGIQAESLEVLLDAKPLNIGVTTEVSYTFTYINNILTITFNQGLSDTQILTIRYVKSSTP